MRDKRQKRAFNTLIWFQTKGKPDQGKSQDEKQSISTSDNNTDRSIQQLYHQQYSNLGEEMRR